MAKVSFVLLAMTCCFLACSEFDEKGKSNERKGIEFPFVLTLYDSDYSMAVTNVFVLDSESITVWRKAGLVHESDSVLYSRKLNDEERQQMLQFLLLFPLNALDSSYVTPYVSDGDQKLFVFTTGQVEKKIRCSNYYHEDLAALIRQLNQLLPLDLKIAYESSVG